VVCRRGGLGTRLAELALAEDGMKYTICLRESGVMFTTHREFGRQVWEVAKLTKKYQGRKCCECGRPLGLRAYRPISNLNNRMERMCLRCAG
jgi:hypothetical protein